MRSERDPKYIYAQEHKLYYYYYHFGGHSENKNKKKRQPNSLKNTSFNDAEYFDWLLT